MRRGFAPEFCFIPPHNNGGGSAARTRAPSPRARGEGRDEGASPLGSVCDVQTRGEAPSPSLRSTSPRARGEVNKHHRSRGAASRPSHAKRRHVSAKPGRNRKSRGGASISLFVTPVSPIPSNEIKKEAERRQTRVHNHRTIGCGARPAGRARLSAFHHGSHTRDSSSQGSTRARLPATRPERLVLNAHANRGVETLRCFSGYYGRPEPVPVQGCTSRAGHNAGRLMPELPGNRVYGPIRGHRTRPAAREYPRWRRP